MVYTVKQLAQLAGVSGRTLHYYDEIGLLKPEFRSANGYRHYGEAAVLRLQQIMFFRELGFSLTEISRILSVPDFDVLEALQSHRTLLLKRTARIGELINTIDKTIAKLRGETTMTIREYYQGFSEEEMGKYRDEVRRRWGEKTLRESERRIIKMGPEQFTALQVEGGQIFQAISDNMSAGYDSPVVQEQVARWQQWLENFHHYSADALLGLGREYSEHPDFSKFFTRYHQDLPSFLTRAIEHYVTHQK